VSFADFRRAGDAPSLVAALIHFDVSFMAWVLLGALGAYVGDDLGLSPAEKGLLVATPLLAGAFFRIVLGLLGDRFGPRRTGTVSMALVLAPLALAFLGTASYGEMLAVGLLLGVAGASFAISLPLASRWYPVRYQGLAMGIAGAGNSGTVVTALVAPRLAEQIGWQDVFGLAMIPVGLALVAFVVLAKEPPASSRTQSSEGPWRPVTERDTWRLCGFYAVTFGGFVGLASFLPIFLHDQYGLSKVDAASLTAVGAALGSLVRPLGGHIADRRGGTRVLSFVYGAAGLLLLLLAGLPPLGVAIIGFPATMGLFGLGNGATFQLVGLRFGERVGIVTGLVGAAGGVGGFLLPTLLGTLKELVGTYAAGLGAVALAALLALAGIAAVRGTWRRGWAAAEARI
jgi:MFS transporter, NNP family, nitrate/nitrite transporter